MLLLLFFFCFQSPSSYSLLRATSFKVCNFALLRCFVSYNIRKFFELLLLIDKNYLSKALVCGCGASCSMSSALANKSSLLLVTMSTCVIHPCSLGKPLKVNVVLYEKFFKLYYAYIFLCRKNLLVFDFPSCLLLKIQKQATNLVMTIISVKILGDDSNFNLRFLYENLYKKFLLETLVYDIVNWIQFLYGPFGTTYFLL